jgi:NAD(P)-dependent dehydrogenase (short-subunit alcohol dehydrogenase family)
MKLAGGTAVVTGASRGIGRAIAQALAGAGAEVALWSRDRKGCEVVAAEIAAAGGTSVPFECDVSDAAAVERAAALVRASMPAVKVVVNNAGAVLRKETAQITDAEWRHVIAVNLDGTFHVSRAFLLDLARARWGPDHQHRVSCGPRGYTPSRGVLRRQTRGRGADESACRGASRC